MMAIGPESVRRMGSVEVGPRVDIVVVCWGGCKSRWVLGRGAQVGYLGAWGRGGGRNSN